MNFSGFLFNRIDTRLKDTWHDEKHLQFKWNIDQEPNAEGVL